MVNKKIKWILPDKNMVKFYEDDDTYTLEEGLKLDNIKTDVTVKVEIKDNTVIKIAVDETKKSEPKVAEQKPPETKPQECPTEPVVETPPDVTIVTWTVSAIKSDKSVLKFEEQSSAKYWYPVKTELLESFANVNKGSVITVKIGKVDAVSQAGETYQKDGIVGIKKEDVKQEEKINDVEQDSKEDVSEKSEYTTNGTSNSIERQVALKEAGAIVRSLIEAQSEMVNTEEKIVRKLHVFTIESLSAMRNA